MPLDCSPSFPHSVQVNEIYHVNAAGDVRNDLSAFTAENVCPRKAVERVICYSAHGRLSLAEVASATPQRVRL